MLLLFQREVNKLQQQTLQYYEKYRAKHHRSILQRKVIIEQRKERLEHINMEKVIVIDAADQCSAKSSSDQCRSKRIAVFWLVAID